MSSCDKHRKRQSVRRRRAAARWFHRNSGEGRMVLDHLQPMGQPANAPGAGRGTWTCCCHRSGARAIGSGRDRRVRVWALEARRALPHGLTGCLTRFSSAVADSGADLDGGSRPAPARTTTWLHRGLALRQAGRASYLAPPGIHARRPRRRKAALNCY